ncbi:MAG: hypothetical protein AAB606_05145 [Patescibacteria group bacterium]
MKNKFLLAGALLSTLLLSSCAAIFEDNGSTTESVGTSTLPVNGTTTPADAAKTSILPSGDTKNTGSDAITAPVETPAPTPVPALDPANGTENPLPKTDTPKPG